MENVTTATENTETVTTATETVTAPAEKVDGRRGPRRSVAADGSVSYGFKKDGTPRQKPGKKPALKSA